MFFEIGSKPLHDMGVLSRKPSDIDWFGPVSQAHQVLDKVFPGGYTEHSKTDKKLIARASLGQGRSVMVEIEDSEATENNRAIYKELLDRSTSATVQPAPPNFLLLFKESHKYKKDSVFFLKTMQDIHLLRGLGAYIPSDLTSLLGKREEETYTNTLPKLGVKKGEFFNPDTVAYKYDHDSIHEAVAVYGAPAYTRYLKDEVMCSEELFNEQQHHIKIAGVMEESMVLALERSLIPFDFKPNPKKAFSMALEKVCTSITSGWFREFAWEHYWQVQATFQAHEMLGSYVENFQQALQKGVVKPFNSTTMY